MLMKELVRLLCPLSGASLSHSLYRKSLPSGNLYKHLSHILCLFLGESVWIKLPDLGRSGDNPGDPPLPESGEEEESLLFVGLCNLVK